MSNGRWNFFKGGVTSGTDFIQPGTEQIDTSGRVRSATEFRILKCTSATLCFETSNSRCLPDDKWTVLATYTQPTDDVVHADTTDGASNKLQRFLRFRIERTAAADWETCFWMNTELK